MKHLNTLAPKNTYPLKNIETRLYVYTYKTHKYVNTHTDSIEANVESAAMNVEHGVERLHKARNYQVFCLFNEVFIRHYCLVLHYLRCLIN